MSKKKEEKTEVNEKKKDGKPDLDKILSTVKINKKRAKFLKVEDELWSDIVDWIPTGAPSLDYAIGGYRKGKRGGIPMGRLTEICGPESSGKSTLLDHIMRNSITLDAIVFLADVEESHGKQRMIDIGIDPESDIRLIEPPEGSTTVTLEHFFEVTCESVKAIRSAGLDNPILVCLDSLAATMLEGEEDTSFMHQPSMKDKNEKAAYLSWTLKNYHSKIARLGTTAIFVNQIREKPGQAFGDPRYSPGGNAVKFFASLRVWLGKGSKINGDDDPLKDHPNNDPVGLSCPFEIKKNKFAPPLKKGKFPLYFDERGICTTESLVDMLLDRDLLERVGKSTINDLGVSWSSRKELIRYLEEKEERREEMEYRLCIEENDE